MRCVVKTTLAIALFIGFSTIGQAADHLDSPSVQADGRLDINDLYAFQSPTNANNVVLIMTVNPVAGIMSPTSFHPLGRYQFHVDAGGDAGTEILFEVTFGNVINGQQYMRVRRNGALLARGRTFSTANLRSAGGGQVTAGVFDDPFFFDAAGFNDSFNFTGTDFFAGLNVSAIVLEVPRSLLGPDNVGIWARTEIAGMQFDRVGRPAISTALIPSGLKNAYNVALPINDVANFGATIDASIRSLNGNDAAHAAAVTAVLLPDILTIDTSDASGFLNGRGLPDDVIDAALTLLTNSPVPVADGVNANDVPFLGAFPYLATAHNFQAPGRPRPKPDVHDGAGH